MTRNSVSFPSLHRGDLTTLQVNLGYRCNQSCSHCHVNAGPSRTEMMRDELMALIPRVVKQRAIRCLDLTGGAPELHPGFRTLVREVRALGVSVLDRCNLTILSEPGQETLASFLAEQRVGVIASLPCYSAANVDKQRGDGVFERSLSGLRQLNALGYGCGDPELTLNLVYNPQGPSLPRLIWRRPTKRSSARSVFALIVCSPWPTCRFSASPGSWSSWVTWLRIRSS